MSELPVIQKTYDFIKWYIPLLNRLPRSHRFMIGERIANQLYDLLEGLVNARYAQQKLTLLEALNSKLDILKYQLFETKYGANFVGFRILPEQVRVRNDNLRRARKRMNQLQEDYKKRKVTLKKLIQRLQSWEAHLKHGDTHQLRKKIFEYWIFTRKN
jgi:hypothetical protein